MQIILALWCISMFVNFFTLRPNFPRCKDAADVYANVLLMILGPLTFPLFWLYDNRDKSLESDNEVFGEY